MREWVSALDELIGPDGEPFDRAKVFPYAFRHSYAQRLADEGASESELMDLMDHDSFETTRGYFRIRAERRRRAAELGRKALFDSQGRRLMRGLEQLAEAERKRMALGSLAVPYGACVEPANVASMGGACKFMLKCLGCKHFRTDLSHLPALEPTSASWSPPASGCWPNPRWTSLRAGRVRRRCPRRRRSSGCAT